MLGVDDDVHAAVRLAHGRDGNARHRGLNKCIKELSSVPNNASVPPLRSRHEARHIYQTNQWDIECIAEPNKSGAFDRSISVKHPRQHRGLIRYQSDGLSPKSPKPTMRLRQNGPGSRRIPPRPRCCESGPSCHRPGLDLPDQIVKGGIFSVRRIPEVEERGFCWLLDGR